MASEKVSQVKVPSSKSVNKILASAALLTFTTIQIFGPIPFLFAQELIQTPQGYIAEKTVDLSEISASLGITPNQNLTPNDITELPVPPFIMRIGDSGNHTVTKTDRGAKNYNFESEDDGGCFGDGSDPDPWPAGMRLSFDNPATTVKETIDLSTYPKLVIGLKGTPATASFGIIDDQGQVALFYLDGIVSNEERVWSITSSEIAAKGVNLSKIWSIDVMVEEQSPEVGMLELMLAPPTVSPVTTLTPADIKAPGSPSITLVKPDGNSSSISYTGRGLILNYATASDGWAGGGFNYDNFSTLAIETQNFSSVSELIFGLKNPTGNLQRVKLEFVDDQDRKVSIYLSGFNSTEQVWRIQPNVLLAQGIDATKIRLIYFIVEGSNLTGALEINRIPLIPPSGSLTADDITDIPDGQIWGGGWIAGGVNILVDTDNDPGHPGFDFGGFHYDDFSTPAIESQDLSNFSQLVFGLKRNGGDYDEVKFEVTDARGRKAFVYLKGVSDTQKIWSVPTAALALQGVNLSKISTVVVVIEKPHQTGALDFIPQVQSLSPVQLKAKKLLDRNQDGTVTAAETIATLREFRTIVNLNQLSYNVSGSDAFFVEFDMNHDAYVKLNDMSYVASSIVALLSPSELKIFSAFQAIDQNHDYLLTDIESTASINAVLGLLGKKATDPGFNSLYDLDKDGLIAPIDVQRMVNARIRFLGISLPVRAGWTLTPSNPNYAYKVFQSRTSSPLADDLVLRIEDLRTGTFKSIIAVTYPNELIPGQQTDITPENTPGGPIAIYLVSGFAWGAAPIWYVGLRRLERPDEKIYLTDYIHASDPTTIESIVYNTNGTVLIQTVTKPGNSAEVRTTYHINLETLKTVP